MYERHQIRRGPADGMVSIGGKPWARAVSRKTGKCALTGKPYAAGDLVYRPILDSMDRHKRMIAAAVESAF